MEKIIFCTLYLIAFLLRPLPAFSQDNSGCSFAAPSALLQPQAYHAYTFRSTAENEAFESADIAKDIHFEIRQSQCVDFIVRKFSFRLKASPSMHPLDLAIKEISNLKLSNIDERPADLLAFLKTGYKRGDRFSACKDGSTAPPGECSWDSLGGYSFEVNRTRNQVIISVTEFTSG